MPGRKPTYEELAARLAEAEEVVATLRNGDADAVVGERSVMLLRLYEAERHLQCLYGLSDLANRQGITLDDLLAGLAGLLPPAWRYPKTACARVVLDDHEFATEGFAATPWRQSADILVGGRPAGRVEVFYREAKPERDEGPFTREERDLLNALAERLGKIIERRRSDDEIRSQKEFLVHVLESVSAPILVIDADDYTVRMANSAARQGGKLAENTRCHELTHGDPLPCRPDDHPCPLKPVKTTGKPAVVEHLHRAPDGSARYHEVRGYPVFDSAGNVIQLIEYMTDVTERRQIVDALLKSEEKYRSLSGNIPGMVYRALPDWSVEFISNSEEVCGYPTDEFVSPGFNWSNIIHPDDREKVFAEAGALGKEKQRVVQEYRIVDKSGAVRWIEDRKVALFDNDGRYKGADGIALDITARKLAEKKIRTLYEELDQRVQERTAELEASNRELESFAYSVSHDLRAPLRAIDGFSQALLEEYHPKLDEQGREYLDRVSNAARRMALLIDDLLKLSRVTRAKMRREPVNLSEMAAEVARELQREHPERDVAVVVGEGAECWGDPPLLRLAVENLLDNAFKFTGRQPEARIEFGLQQNGDQAAFFVKDDGVGFDMAYIGKLFTPFQRLHSRVEFPGTGIGLATVQRIVHRHGGRVWAEGQVDRGATFYFTLLHRKEER